MELNPGNVVRWLFDSRQGLPDRLIPRWIFLRALAVVYFSAFYSLLFQIKGLIGPLGILPAQQYLAAVARAFGSTRVWYAPSLFWLSAAAPALMAITWIGLVASIVAFLNLWPRLSLFVCFVCFLSFVTASSAFSNYQSDGMLLEAGFIALFFAPRGVLSGWGATQPPSRASLFLLQWEWFRIYFESGIVKLLSGDVEWRNFTAMDEYYQNGPLPTWIGWYVEHLPHWFHAASTAATLVLELVIVFMLFFPRRIRLICFFIVTPWEIGVILTANYTFLNYLVLSLGFLLLDDKFLRRFVPLRYRPPEPASLPEVGHAGEPSLSILDSTIQDTTIQDSTILAATIPDASTTAAESNEAGTAAVARVRPTLIRRTMAHASAIRLATATVMLSWIGYDTTVEMISIPLRTTPLPTAPIAALDPFRVANQYGLFAVMTRGRYEIEFQGSSDGQNWTPYPFRYKPQALNQPPGIYAPYQPRFEWNLWFASLGDWRQNEMVPVTEERLLTNDADVLALFQSNPFPESPPRYVRAVLWQYWFTSTAEKRTTGNWWRRQLLGVYAPEITLTADGKPSVVEWPDELPAHD